VVKMAIMSDGIVNLAERGSAAPWPVGTREREERGSAAPGPVGTREMWLRERSSAGGGWEREKEMWLRERSSAGGGWEREEGGNAAPLFFIGIDDEKL
ncbi:MAG TPA: hypothetical protein PKI62_09535, partial [bacterium]|nr:hypothetical protein [bacterium]